MIYSKQTKYMKFVAKNPVSTTRVPRGVISLKRFMLSARKVAATSQQVTATWYSIREHSI